MSGKSTLVGAVRLNAVLALAGALVPTPSLRLSRLSVWASLSVVDSLMNGRSRFMAEVDRLRRKLEDAARAASVLFLVDRGAIGAVSTHDVALCEIAAVKELRGVNVHMSSREGDDPMDFDFRLKPGVTSEASALAIAMAGVSV